MHCILSGEFNTETVSIFIVYHHFLLFLCHYCNLSELSDRWQPDHNLATVHTVVRTGPSRQPTVQHLRHCSPVAGRYLLCCLLLPPSVLDHSQPTGKKIRSKRGLTHICDNPHQFVNLHILIRIFIFLQQCSSSEGYLDKYLFLHENINCGLLD